MSYQIDQLLELSKSPEGAPQGQVASGSSCDGPVMLASRSILNSYESGGRPLLMRDDINRKLEEERCKCTKLQNALQETILRVKDLVKENEYLQGDLSRFQGLYHLSQAENQTMRISYNSALRQQAANNVSGVKAKRKTKSKIKVAMPNRDIDEDYDENVDVSSIHQARAPQLPAPYANGSECCTHDPQVSVIADNLKRHCTIASASSRPKEH